MADPRYLLICFSKPSNRSGASPSRAPGRHAFTLVELLVVIGIIAALIAILMPVLSRATEAAHSIKCLSNLRQIGMAISMYNNENRGHYPAPSVGPSAQDLEPDDWIFWGHGRDINQGAVALYMNPPLDHEQFRCPSDPMIDSHLNHYPYSYSVNWMICEPRSYNNKAGGWVSNAFDAYRSPTRGREKPNLQNTQIRNPEHVILAVDESSQTIDDGCWCPQHYLTGDGRNLLSNRHDRDAEKSEDPNAGRGNAVFCDGHAEFMQRLDSIDKHYFDPRKDGSWYDNSTGP